MLGDSISAAYGMEPTQGWVSLLDRKLNAEGFDIPVINASVSGETTSGGLARLPSILSRNRPRLVILELGGNDGLQGYPTARIRENLRSMIRMIRDADAYVLLVGMHIPPNYGPRYTTEFHAVFTDLAEQEKVSLLPFMLEGVALEPGLLQADGIHPTARAQEIMLRNIWPQLRALL